MTSKYKSRGDYTVVQGDHIRYRYEIVEMLGKGSFGQVFIFNYISNVWEGHKSI